MDNCSKYPCDGLALIDQRLTTMHEDLQELKKVLLIGNGERPFVAETRDRLQELEEFRAVQTAITKEKRTLSSRSMLLWGLLFSAGLMLANLGMLYAAIHHYKP